MSSIKIVVYSSQIHKASKDYKCSQCGEIIKSGENYARNDIQDCYCNNCYEVALVEIDEVNNGK